MKRLLHSVKKVIALYLILVVMPAIGQQTNPVTIHVSAPKIVNFKSQAEYLLQHPKETKQCIIDQMEDRDADYAFKPHHVPENAPAFNTGNQPESSARSASPTPKNVYGGTIGNGSYYPPDINGAVGKNYILESTNQEIDVFQKTTGSLFLILDLPTIFANDTFTFFDPHIEYDAAHNRYILLCDGWDLYNYDMGAFVAVSQTSDPTGNWYTYSADASDGLPSGYYFFDYPLLGYNEKWVVVTGNYFNYNSNSVHSDVYVFNRADLYSGSLGTAKEFFDPIGVTLTPAQTYDTALTYEYLVQNSNGNQNKKGYVQIGSISGPLNTPVFSDGSAIGVTSAWSDSGQIGASQEGTSQNIESGLDTRIENAVYRNGSLWFTHNVYLPSIKPTHVGIDWWQVNPSALTVTQFGRIEDPNGSINYFYPSINVNANGNALVGYCTSSPNLYASSEYSYRSSGDASNMMDNGYIFQNGSAPYIFLDNNYRNRYGDYTFTSVDPSDNSFWTFQEYAVSQNDWGTTIANVAAGPSGINSVSVTTPSIEVFPNPTTGQFDVTLNNLSNGVYTIALYNIIGQKLLEKQTTLNSKYSKVSMDASAFSSGLYFVRVASENGEWAQRIVKR